MGEDKKTTKAHRTIKKVPSVNAGADASDAGKSRAASPVSTVDKAQAKSKRTVAVIFWVLAVAFEVLALLVYVGKADLRFISEMAQLIAFLVLDFVCVVVGAQFWKRANHIDPVSEANKTKFWLWNNMGVIVCCFAFIPFLIYVLFADKNADPKMKKVASIVAAVALVLGIGLSYDYKPVSQEGLAQAQETLAGEEVYWTKFGSVYHINPDCQHLNRSSEIFQGDVATAVANNKPRLCKTCAKNEGITIGDNGALEKTTESSDELLPEAETETADNAA